MIGYLHVDAVGDGHGGGVAAVRGEQVVGDHEMQTLGSDGVTSAVGNLVAEDLDRVQRHGKDAVSCGPTVAWLLTVPNCSQPNS